VEGQGGKGCPGPTRGGHEFEAKRDLRKSGPPLASHFQCQICLDRSRIGLT